MRNEAKKCQLLCLNNCQQKYQKLIHRKINRSNFQKLSLKKINHYYEDLHKLNFQSQQFKSIHKDVQSTTDRSNLETSERNAFSLNVKKMEIQNQLLLLNRNLQLLTSNYNKKIIQLNQLKRQINQNIPKRV